MALVALALLAVVWLDITKGGEATPGAPLGEIGTPVRGAFVAPSPTPIGAKPTPRARPTVTGSLKGTPAERDAQRRSDLLTLVNAMNQVKAQEGAYPSTAGNVQTVCVFQNVDVGCKFKDVLGAAPPSDPIGEPLRNGYWYASDGSTARVFAALEGDRPDDPRCDTPDTELNKKSNVICIKVP